MLTEDFLYAWSQSEASISELTDSLLNVIALVRYETDFTSLSDTKQNNVLKIHRITKNIGQNIARPAAVYH